jgi:hypothetical protein
MPQHGIDAPSHNPEYALIALIKVAIGKDAARNLPDRLGNTSGSDDIEHVPANVASESGSCLCHPFRFGRDRQHVDSWIKEPDCMIDGIDIANEHSQGPLGFLDLPGELRALLDQARQDDFAGHADFRSQ